MSLADNTVLQTWPFASRSCWVVGSSGPRSAQSSCQNKKRRLRRSKGFIIGVVVRRIWTVASESLTERCVRVASEEASCVIHAMHHRLIEMISF